MRRNQFARACAALAITALLGATDLVAQQKWPIKRFKVETSPPKHWFIEYMEMIAEFIKGTLDPNYWKGVGDEQYWEWEKVLQQWESESYIELTDAQVAEVEKYLGRVAEQFERWGFPQPASSPIVHLFSHQGSHRRAGRVYEGRPRSHQSLRPETEYPPLAFARAGG